ncbi:MAG: two-component system sensor histidine kinase GlrK [Motiliproteus sp.]|jgi:two-component system sensor histidine kinase GlrK
MLWRPRSLLQLVLIGFFTVMAPLCVAIFYTVQAFDRLSVNNSQMTEQLVALTRSSQLLQSELLDLERSAGQYQALGGEKLQLLFEQGLERIGSRLDEIESLVDTDLRFYLLSLTAALEPLRLAMRAAVEPFDPDAGRSMFDRINSMSLELRHASQQYVDAQLEQQVLDGAEIKRSLVWMLSLLVLLTLLAVLFFTYWINRPVRQLEREIGRLGRGDFSRRIRIKGPQELQLLGEKLEWLRDRLNELDAQKQQFLRHMSHELKTPLASLREGADLMAEGVVGSLDSRQHEIVEIIQQNSTELQRLIENLLDYNQLQHHRQLKTAVVDIPALWSELLAGYAITIERKKLRISSTGEPLCWIADPAKLRTLLDNLLSNAISYSPPAGEVQIEWWLSGTTLICDVRNSGEAITAADAAQIFEPFFQGRNKRSGAIKGSGIGLSVALECVAVHEGSLQLVPDDRLPVCFRLMLPILEEQR